ncbi:hypothetical protein SKAU_G00219720 [Synaphobranchus kaupii]|uniref:Uncharacterized protein n=1 Tax=Synaphobranchus kaupii TaxID=118154 RepID=A0A9Q1ITQ9_SYNKA|nr:hypothetical protein SKAU_G00219720 [Synaphobranchus kaupii]
MFSSHSEISTFSRLKILRRLNAQESVCHGGSLSHTWGCSLGVRHCEDDVSLGCRAERARSLTLPDSEMTLSRHPPQLQVQAHGVSYVEAEKEWSDSKRFG